MSYSKSSDRDNCCQHQEEIHILQEKLMEIHNKLLDQLDVCREQELSIIELSKQLMKCDNNKHVFDTFQYQSFGQNSN
jgi:hypothetical protein